MPDIPAALRTQQVGVPRVIPTADVLRALPYHAGPSGWHSHGDTGNKPTDGCAACAELRKRQSAPPSEEDGA